MRSPWRKLAAGLTMALAAAVAALVPPAQAATGIIIAIDPGHGGSDPGAVANGLQEKDLTLAVSLALKEELETYDGVTVVMTRTSDTRPSENLSDDLSSRVQMAAAADADAHKDRGVFDDIAVRFDRRIVKRHLCRGDRILRKARHFARRRVRQNQNDVADDHIRFRTQTMPYPPGNRPSPTD